MNIEKPKFEKEKEKLFRDVAVGDRANGEVINVDGVEIGIRYPDGITDQLKHTSSLKEAGILSRSKKGHGYIEVEIDDNKMVIGYKIQQSDWEAIRKWENGEGDYPYQDEIFIKEKESYQL